MLLGEEVSARGSAEGAVGRTNDNAGNIHGAVRVQVTHGKGNEAVLSKKTPNLLITISSSFLVLILKFLLYP